MTEEQRNKQLKKLVNSSMGKALMEHLQMKIDKLTDARNYNNNDFETEGKSSLKAADILEKELKSLSLIKNNEKDKDKENNEYL